MILITALNDLNRQDQALAGTAYECIHTQVNNLTKHYCDKKNQMNVFKNEMNVFTHQSTILPNIFVLQTS